MFKNSKNIMHSTSGFKRPFLTEKAISVNPNQQTTVCVIEVDRRMNKKQIAQMAEIMFSSQKAKVYKVRTMITGGTMHDRGKRRQKAGKDLVKKAIITFNKETKVYLGGM